MEGEDGQVKNKGFYVYHAFSLTSMICNQRFDFVLTIEIYYALKPVKIYEFRLKNMFLFNSI